MAVDRSPPTSWLQHVAAVLVGVLVYRVLVVDLQGSLAAVAVPRQFFAWFGPARQASALAVIHLGQALLVLVLVAGSVLAACRVMRTKRPPFLLALLTGMLVCHIASVADWVLAVPAGLPADVSLLPAPARFQQLLASYLRPWWAVPGAWAPWLGFALAWWLLRRRPPA